MHFSRTRRVLVTLLAIALLAVAPVDASAQNQSDVDRAERQVEESERAKSQAYDRWVAAREELDAAVVRYEEVYAELSNLTYTIALLYENIIQYENEVGDLKDRAEDLVLEAYINGGTGLMSAAFEAGSIQDLLTSQVLIDKATSRDLASLDRLEAVSREMDRRKADLKVKEDEVRLLEQEAGELVGEMDRLYDNSRTAYNDADAANKAAIDNYNKEKAEFAAAEARRKAQAAATARTRSSGAAAGLPPEATPGFVCPVRGGASFINSWGFPRSGGRSHKGTDMFAPRGTDLVAVTGGTVSLRTVNLGGIVTYLNGDDGNRYYYAHLDGYPAGLSSGQRVERGQTVGLLGSTGNAYSPHLHFEIRVGGRSVNPYPTVRYYC